MQNLVYEWIDFSKSGQIWAKNGSNLRKFWKKSVISFNIWPKIGSIGIWLFGLLFLEKLVFVWVYFQIRGGTKTKLEYPPNVGIGLYWITVGSVIYVIQAWKFSAFPRISDFCVCLRRCYFFTLKTRVFIAKRTKNRNVGPTKLLKTNIKIGKYYIAQDWNNNYRNPCPYLPSVPILADHPDFRPSKT